MVRLRLSIVVVCLLALLPQAAQAAPLLTGTSVSVELQQSVLGDFSDTVVVADGAELSEVDGSNIGDNVFLPGESIDVGGQSIVFTLFGGDTSDEVSAGPPRYLGTGLGPDARYVVSDLFDPLVARIVGISVLTTNALFAPTALGASFTDHSVTLMLAGLGILESGSNLGLVTINLQLEELTFQPVPEPATLTLFGVSLAGAGLRSYRRRRAASSRQA